MCGMRMKRRKLFRAIEGAAFCALLMCVIALVSRAVERKASVNKIQPFLERAQEFDVLFVGDSQMVNDVFPMELWKDYGIASYNTASYGNTMPVNYWTMMNALDYASPKLMVIGVKDLEKSYKLSGSSSDVHTAFDGYPLSLTKIRAIEDLMAGSVETDDDGNDYDSLRWEYYFTLGKYHTRWSELQLSDFRYDPNRTMGAQMTVGVSEPREYALIDEERRMEENGWGFLYLRRMIEECESRGIDVLLLHLPYPATEEEQEAANTVYTIAQDYGVGYIDFVYLDQVVDYETDCYDAFSHLNPSGAQKVTDYLGRYIVSHYDIPDRRTDAPYASWDNCYADYLQYKQYLLRLQSSPRSVLALLHDDSFSVCVSIAPGSDVYRDRRAMRLLQNIAREHIFEDDEEMRWADSLMPLALLDGAAQEREAYFLLFDSGAEGSAPIERVGEAEETFETSFGTLRYRMDGGKASLLAQDGEDFFAVAEGTNAPQMQILVVDNETGERVAVMRY